LDINDRFGQSASDKKWIDEKYCELAEKYLKDKNVRERVDKIYNSVGKK